MMSFYLNAINGGNTIGPLICGFVITSLSWRWHKWIAFILTFINFLVVVLFCPETRYYRSGVRTVGADEAAVDQVSESSSQNEIAEQDAEKAGISTTKETTSDPDLQQDQIPKKTWKQELSLWSGTPKDTSLLKLFIRPLPLIVYPAVILSFLGF